MILFAQHTPIFVRHFWLKKVDIHMRQMLLRAFPVDSFVTHSDFSAVGSGCAQNKKNSARPFHFIQAVVVASTTSGETVKITAEDTKKQHKQQRVESVRYERHIRNESHHFLVINRLVELIVGTSCCLNVYAKY